MSVVPFSSPSLSSNTNIDQREISSVSSLLDEYRILNSIIETKQFEQTLEVYSMMLTNNSFYPEKKLSLQTFLHQFLKELNQISLNELEELNQIFEDLNFRSLISSYDSILAEHYQEKNKSHSQMSFTPKLIDEEKENSSYASKLAEYNVTRLKIVHLEKRSGEPLGATISRLSDNDYRISIARIVHGSISQGLFTVGDQLLEINHLPISSEYRTLDQIVQLIDSLDGNITFLLLPTTKSLSNDGIENEGFSKDFDCSSSIYVRTLFSYDPQDDIYIPCRELGLKFEKNYILQIVNRDDHSWWQAFLLENDQKQSKQSYPALIPSQEFQEKRLKIVKCLLDEQTNDSKKKFKHKFTKSTSPQSTRQTILTTFSFGIYELVQWYIPNPSRKRPIVLIGAPHIGRHELRQRLMNSSEFSSIIDVAVPHTTRRRKGEEIDGRDYHFITREQFEKDISNDLFVEHGEYETNLYGTSKLAIEICTQQLNKICILNLLPEGLHSLKYSNLLPFIIYIKPPTTIEKLKESFPINDQQWIEIQEKSRFIEQNYSHLFDQILSFNHSFDLIFSQLKSLVYDVQSKSMWLNQFWFSPKHRF